MNPYIGDRPLDPPEEEEFYCFDCDQTYYSFCDLESHREHCDTVVSDPGEPNEEPDL